MRCQWQSFLNLLPARFREPIDRLGKDDLQELRLRLGQAPELIRGSGILHLPYSVSQVDLTYIVNMATQYSPWATDSSAQGFISAAGGHRIGICGTTAIQQGLVTGFKEISSLCIRIARDIPGIGKEAIAIEDSFLIIGRPGAGKTTLLRDIVRQISELSSQQIVVIDEREELFPLNNGAFAFPPGKHTDVLSGCNKVDGIDMALRCMGPDMIVVDEITSAKDCESMLRAGWCGVRLVATAHAGSLEELYRRPVYQPIIKNGLFDHVVVLLPDKSWYVEEVDSRC